MNFFQTNHTVDIGEHKSESNANSTRGSEGERSTGDVTAEAKQGPLCLSKQKQGTPARTPPPLRPR